jgi:1-acyl-sn-glycerol-3-phosphate acyltransferase
MQQERDAQSEDPAGRPVEAVVAALVAELADRPGELPKPETHLSEAGFDSLLCAELALAVEERFGVRLADTEVGSVRTVGEVAEHIRRRLPSRPRLPADLGKYQPLVTRAASPLLRPVWHLSVTGAEHVPDAGPAILAANHRSMWDIPIHVVASPRPIVFMAKSELYKTRALHWVWRVLGGFPVRREMADLRAIDTALAVLESGGIVGIYPEGKRSKHGDMLPFLNGAAWLAVRTGAPIVPAGITGTGKSERRLPVPTRVRVAFGPPVQVEREVDPKLRQKRAHELTERLLADISALTR